MRQVFFQPHDSRFWFSALRAYYDQHISRSHPGNTLIDIATSISTRACVAVAVEHIGLISSIVSTVINRAMSTKSSHIPSSGYEQVS